MAIITKEVEVKVGKNAFRYMQLGYDIPTKKKEYEDRHKTILPNNMVFDTSKTVKIKFEDLPKFSTAPIEVECDICKKRYFVTKSNLLNYTTYKETGMTICENCARSVYFTGEKACRYNKDKTDEERGKNRYSLEYINMQRRVIKRDGFKCSICSSHSNLEVHHLNSYTDFTEQRCDDNNCVTLCKNCHKNFHFVYGYSHNTKKQFEEWSNTTLLLKETNKEEVLQEAKKIYCYETDEVYFSALDCANKLGFIKTSMVKHIRGCCRNKKNATSYRGLHFVYAEDVKGMSSEEKVAYILDIILKVDRKIPYIDLNTGTVYFSGEQYKRHSVCDKDTNLTNIRYTEKKVLNGVYEAIPYSMFKSFSKENQKKICNKPIRLFNILNKTGGKLNEC